MAYELIKEEGASRTIRFTMDAIELKKIFRKIKKSISKEVSIRGFRPGHVPDSIIEKKYGNLIVAEVADDVHKKLSFPLFENVDWILSDKAPDFDNTLPVEGADFSYEVTYHTFETPEPVDYKEMKLKIPRYNLDEVVKKTLEDISKQFVEYVETDKPSEEDNLVIVSYPGLAEDNATEKEINLVVGQETIGEGIDKFITGVRPGDTFTAQMVGKDEKTASSSPPVTFTVKEVRAHKFPEIDDEFAKKIAGMDSIDEYRQKIYDDASIKFEEEAKAFRNEQIVEKLLESNKFEVPNFMVHNLMEDFSKDIEQNDQSEETTKILKELSEKKVREFLILREIAIKEDLSVKQEEVEQATADGDSKTAFIDRNRNDLALDFIFESAVIEEIEIDEPAKPENPTPWKWEKVEPLPVEEVENKETKIDEASRVKEEQLEDKKGEE